MTEPNTPNILKWRGQKVYRCRLCAFDSTDQAKFEDHFRRRHAPFQVIDGGKAATTSAPDIHKMTRDELNIYGPEHGVPNAADTGVYPTKADVIAAIEAAYTEE